MTLDEIQAAQDDLKRQQQRQNIQRMSAAMATEIEQIKAEDWKAPEDVELAPVRTIETPAPADWFIRGEIAKAKLADDIHHFTLEADPS